MGNKASTICLHLDLSCLAACYASSHVRFISFNSGDIVHRYAFLVGLSLSSVVEFISVRPWRFAPGLFWGHAIAITFSRVLFPVPHCCSIRFSYRAVCWKFSQARRWSWLSWGRVCGRRWFHVTCHHSSVLHTNHTAAPILHCSCMVRCWFLNCNASIQMEWSIAKAVFFSRWMCFVERTARSLAKSRSSSWESWIHWIPLSQWHYTQSDAWSPWSFLRGFQMFSLSSMGYQDAHCQRFSRSRGNVCTVRCPILDSAQWCFSEQRSDLCSPFLSWSLPVLAWPSGQLLGRVCKIKACRKIHGIYSNVIQQQLLQFWNSPYLGSLTMRPFCQSPGIVSFSQMFLKRSATT